MSKSEEKRKNCANCNKSLGRIDWYYKNGGYYCNKKCFKTFLSKKSQEAAA